MKTRTNENSWKNLMSGVECFDKAIHRKRKKGTEGKGDLESGVSIIFFSFIEI